jgi:hypothetical protein
MFDRSVLKSGRYADIMEGPESWEDISLADSMIEQAADEMARLEWPGLRKTKVKKADVQKVRGLLERTERRLQKRTKEQLSRLSAEEQLALVRLLGRAVLYDMSVADLVRVADEAREEIHRRLGLRHLATGDQLVYLIRSLLSRSVESIVDETIQKVERRGRLARR